MENELQQLMLLNPQLQISQDASEYDMPYMNHGDKVLNAQKDVTRVQMEYLTYFKKNFDYKPLIERLFTDVAYVESNFDVYEFVSRLFRLASNIQSTESRHDTSLYNAFTNDELYRLWQVANAWWYLHYGPAPQNGGTQPFS